MINIKTNEEIEMMRKGGKILASVLFEVLEKIRVGVSEIDLDRLAKKLIIEKGGKPAFERVEGYKHTICVSTNNTVVHGIPTNYKFKEGDVVGVDCGVYFEGFNTDAAHTVRVQKSSIRPIRQAQGRQAQDKSQKSDEIDKFLEIGKEALWAGIEQARIGNRVGHISKAIQGVVEKKGGYSIVRSLVGHGVGRSLHEEPEVPGFLNRPISKTPLLQEGMTIAIEVIYNLGKKDVIYANNDGWTIKTKDGKLSGLFERTVAITKGEPLILTN